MALIERTVTVVNELGLHARPSAALVEAAQAFSCEIRVAKDGGDPINGKSILGLMTLAAECGSALTVIGEGDDAAEAVETLVRLIEGGFEE